MNTKKRIALIPAYEPDYKMLKVVKELKNNNFDIVVVDDGSGTDKDGLFLEASKYGKVIAYETNRGKGAALKTGLKYIFETFSAPYTVVTVDADGQHKTEDVLRVCQESESNRSKLILGSRKFTGKVPLRSRFGNTITRYVYKLTCGADVYDTQTGLRGFSDDLIYEMLQIPGDRYEYEMNVLMTIPKTGRQIKEVWIETVYLDDNSSSHFDTLKDSYRIYKDIIKFSGSSFISFLIDYLLYCLFMGISGNLVLSNVAARIISSGTNYTMNRKYVFRSNAPLGKSLMQYVGLAVFILIANTLILNGLSGLGINVYLAKIITEMLMFIVSWTVQNKIIFRKDNA